MTGPSVPATIVAAAAQRLADHAPHAAIAAWTPTGEAASLPFGARPVGDIGHDVDAAPPAAWLWRGVWPSDAYGVLAAPPKVGKTWIVLDAAVSVAAGTPWLGVWPCERPGPVLALLGEGGARKMTRRGRAVAAAYGQAWDDLPITLAPRAPRLLDAGHVAALRELVDAVRPQLVLLDPLYLAMAGADHRSLYAMGEALGALQEVAQAADAALLVAHHTNRDRAATGAARMSGAGPQEWGRVLVTVDKATERVDDTGASDARLTFTVEGDEIQSAARSFRRTIHATGEGLDAPLTYAVDAEDEAPILHAPTAGRNRSQQRIGRILETSGGWLTCHELGDGLARDEAGAPLKKRTIQVACRALVDAGLVDVHNDGAGSASAWRWRSDL